MADDRTESRQQIDATIARLRQDVQGIGDDARAQAWRIAEHGLTIGEEGHRLVASHTRDWEAPKLHPVWAPELAHEVRVLERMGAATFEYADTSRQLDAWAAAGVPEIRAEDDHLRQEPSQAYGQENPTVLDSIERLQQRVEHLDTVTQEAQERQQHAGMGY